MPALHAKIKKGVVEYPGWLGSDCKHLLSRMLVANPLHRASLAEVMNDTWMNKGHEGPLENFLPPRNPLSLPLDMEVIRGMTGFEFGTEQEIKMRLENIIKSESYQNSIKNFIYPTHISGASSSNRTFTADPTQAVHPLISIYYLVKEKLERERLIQQGFIPQFGSSSSSLVEQNSLQTPHIPLPDPSYPSETGFDINMNSSSASGNSSSAVPIRRATVPSGARPRSRTNGEVDFNIGPIPPVIVEREVIEENPDDGELSYAKKGKNQHSNTNAGGVGLIRRLSLAIVGQRETTSPQTSPISPIFAVSRGQSEHRRHGSTPTGVGIKSESIRLSAFLLDCLAVGCLKGFKRFELYLRGREELLLRVYIVHKSTNGSSIVDGNEKTSSTIYESSRIKYNSLSLAKSHHDALFSPKTRRTPLDNDLSKDESNIVFLIAGYARYKYIKLWDIIEEVITLSLNIAPENPFEINHSYYDTLPVEECAVSTGAMIDFLQKVYIKDTNYANK
ncbi:6945_t:CDS:2, partial [Entrophospora sp. SA101]